MATTTKPKTQTQPNPDLLRSEDPAYWAAAAVLAVRSGNRTRQEKTQRELRRLGFDLRAVGSKGGER